MQIPQKKLNSHLNQKIFLPAYLVCGDFPLLVQETRDTIREAARKKGFQQCALFFIETGFDWQNIIQSLNNVSLLKNKILIELRNPKAKFDAAGIQALLRYLNNPPDDKRLLIITNKLTTAQQKTNWYEAINRWGAIIPVCPLSKQSVLSWIGHQLENTDLIVDDKSIQRLAELTEGNLLATRQAIEKMRLLYYKESITTKIITAVINESAYFTVFDLTEAALMGEKSRVMRILSNLYFSDKEVGLLVLWAMTRELRILYPLAIKYQQGKSFAELLESTWQVRRQVLQVALMRLNATIIAKLLQEAKHIDHIIKGLALGNVRQSLETLSLHIAGVGKDLL